MIESFRLINFRGFEDSGPIRIAPITVLVGENSSGKSSIVQSLLLLKQSLIQPRRRMDELARIILDGPDTQLGNYADLVYKHETDRHVGITFTVAPDKNKTRPSILFSPPIVGSSAFEDRFARLRYAQHPVRRRTVIGLEFFPAEPFGPAPSRHTIRVDRLGRVTSQRAGSTSKRVSWRTTFGTPLSPNSITLDHKYYWGSILPEVRLKAPEARKLSRAKRAHAREFAQNAEAAYQAIEHLCLGLRSLGPFRTPPERHYWFSGSEASSTGANGERAIDLLLMESLITGPARRTSLLDGVQFWLARMGLASGLQLRALLKDIRMFGVELAGAAGSPVLSSIADVGFGLSQVLPVVVQGLLTPPRCSFVVQQPELHLHPDAQAAMGDFLWFLASRGVRVIAETHSEYLLARLRRRLAEDADEDPVVTRRFAGRAQKLSRRDIAVHFVGEDSGARTVTEIPIGANFQFETLPPKFMGSALDDRLVILRAAAPRSRARK